MFADPTNFLVLLALTLAAYYLVPARQPLWRQIVVLLASMFAILAISPRALAVAAAMILITCAFVAAHRRGKPRRGFGFAISGVLVVLALAPKYWDNAQGIAESIGLSYVLLKLLSVVWFVEWRNYEPRNVGFLDVASLSLFFPIYSAGPVERAEAFTASRFARPFSLESFLVGVYRILLGLFLIQFIANDLLNALLERLGPVAELGPGNTWVVIWLSFLMLFAQFSGYTHMAIGAARLFNLDIIENFDRPYLSTSIREFWTRWHISLARFVSTFLFLPVVRAMKGAVTIPLISAFVLIGLWHSISWNYLAWGLCHGGLLAAYRGYDRKSLHMPKWDQFRRGNMVWRAAAMVGTISYVSLVSAFANAVSLKSGFALLARALALQ